MGEVGEEDEFTTINFYYQGVYFAISLETERMDQLVLPLVAEVPYTQLHLVQSICNQLNLQSEVGRVAYVYNHESHQLEVGVMMGLNLHGTVDSKVNGLHALLQMGFTQREAFNKIYKQEVGDNEKGLDEDVEMEHRRELYLLREQEVVREPPFVTKKWRNDYRTVTLGFLIDNVLEDDTILPTRMSVQKFSTDDMTTETVDSVEHIRDYPLWHTLIKGEGKKAAFASERAVLVVSFTTEVCTDDTSEHQLYVMVEQAGEANNTLYMRVTVTIPPYGYFKRTTSHNSVNQVRSRSLLVPYDKVNNRQRRSEFEYMWHDIQDKKRLHKTKELTEEQHFIYDCDDSDIATRLYWGRKYFLRKDYCQALFYLEDVFSSMQWQYATLSQKMLHLFLEICYMAGFCYCELEAYKKALYYLEIVALQDNLIYLKAYVNCLVKAGDFRTIDVIDGLTERMEEIFDDEDELEDGHDMPTQDFYRFLLQRKIMGYINCGDLEDAENLCQSLLKLDKKSKDYALDELARIQKLRRQKEREKDDEK